jgi:hypothetical protein
MPGCDLLSFRVFAALPRWLSFGGKVDGRRGLLPAADCRRDDRRAGRTSTEDRRRIERHFREQADTVPTRGLTMAGHAGWQCSAALAGGTTAARGRFPAQPASAAGLRLESRTKLELCTRARARGQPDAGAAARARPAAFLLVPPSFIDLQPSSLFPHLHLHLMTHREQANVCPAQSWERGPHRATRA